MGEARELQLNIITTGDHDAAKGHERRFNSAFTATATAGNHQETIVPPRGPPKDLKWWIRVSVYSLFVLAGQSVATLLGRQYYDKGGHSKWLATVVQLVGFPILFPCYLIPTHKHSPADLHAPLTAPPSLLALSLVYLTIGSLAALDCYLYSVGLQYLPVSTYSLICASQLGFNAFFSFFLNRQKFTPFIVNSIVLLTISSVLLVFQPSQGNANGSVSRAKYAIGFVCTVLASAGYGLVLSLMQLCFSRVIKKETFRAVLDMIVWQSVVASLIAVVGLLGSGEWESLRREGDKYELGKASYVMNLTGTAVAWQVFAIGAVGLIFDVSSLFSNSISAVGLPIVPVFAVVFFHERMNGIKVISLVLAVWGFVSYIYQHYLDDNAVRLKTGKAMDDDVAHRPDPVKSPTVRSSS